MIGFALPVFVTGGFCCQFSQKSFSIETYGRRARFLAPKQRASRLCVRAAADYYEVLGVPRDADTAAIKKAYRRAALRSHPDVSKAPNAKERFLEIQAAYAVLSDTAKRREYDRKSASGFGGFDSFDDFASAASGGAAGFSSNASEYARKWREKNPMPEDLDDNLGSIFSDLFSGVSGAVGGAAKKGSGGIFEDFVEYLEDQVGGFSTSSRGSSGYDSDGSSPDDGLEEILRSGSLEVLEAELDDTVFLLTQLDARREKLARDAELVESRAREWKARSDRPKERLDYYAREEAQEREKELRDEADRLRRRQKKVKRHISAQEVRRDRIKAAIASRKAQKSSSRSSRTSTGTGSSYSSQEQKKREIDDELARMKREMGLS